MSRTALINITTKIGSGATPTGGQRSYKEQGIALIRSQNVLDFRFSKDKLAFIDEEQASQLDNVTVEEHDVLLNITGDSIARVCVVPKEILPARVNQHVSIIRGKKGIDSRYLMYYLLYLKPYLLKICGVGGTRNALTKEVIENIEIEIGDNHAGIAAVLSSLDAKIDLNRRINAELESMANLVFHQWFVAANETKGWRIGRLGDVADNIRRGVNPDAIQPETPYIGLEHMPRKCIALSDWGNASDLESNKYSFKTGEFLFGKLRPYFHKVGIAPVDGVCSTDILVIAPKSSEWYGYVLGHIASEKLVKYADTTSGGTKMPRTSWANLAKYEMPMPPIERAEQFSKFFLRVSQRIRTNIVESRTLMELRDWLLPMLMNGQVKVGR